MQNFHLVGPAAIDHASAVERAEHWRQIDSLYRILGKQLLETLTGDISKLQHIVQVEETSEDDLFVHRSKAMAALVAKLLYVSEVPVVTRFWLYEEAIKNLLLWHLLQLPFEGIMQVRNRRAKPPNSKPSPIAFQQIS